MRKRRAAAFERRQQMYKLENEEGYEEGALVDGLLQEEDEAEMTDMSDTEDEDDGDVEEDGEEKDWVRSLNLRKERLSVTEGRKTGSICHMLNMMKKERLVLPVI